MGTVALSSGQKIQILPPLVSRCALRVLIWNDIAPRLQGVVAA
jgi:hypothetical protein